MRESAERARDRKAEIEGHPFIQGVSAEMTQATRDGRDPFDVLDQQDWAGFVSGLVAEEVSLLRTYPLYNSPFRILDGVTLKGFVLVNHPAATITVTAANRYDFSEKKARTGADQGTVAISSTDHYLKLLCGRGVTVSRWGIPEAGSDPSPSASLQCRRMETVRLEPGDSIRAQGGREAISFDSAEDTLVVVQAVGSVHHSPVVPEFKLSDGSLIAVAAADQTSSRIQMMSTLLRMAAPHKAPAAFRELVGHRDHFVRWHVMREWLACAPESARPHLAEMARADPSAEVRNLASRTLAGFFADQEV